ncbi:MAG: hypothetical protein RL757_1113 [Bacteroidota bacterium]|jgi:hypothetical protein
MEEFSITTPAVLFPAISLLMLAYTNRFLAISNLIRNLKGKYIEKQQDHLLVQLRNLRRRIYIIRNMQWFGAFSLFMCVLSMFSAFEHNFIWARHLFSIGLGSMVISLALSLREIHLSVIALNAELQDIENELGKENPRLPLDFFPPSKK